MERTDKLAVGQKYHDKELSRMYTDSNRRCVDEAVDEVLTYPDVFGYDERAVDVLLNRSPTVTVILEIIGITDDMVATNFGTMERTAFLSGIQSGDCVLV